MEVGSQVHVLAILPKSKSTLYRFDQMLGGSDSRHGQSGDEEKNICPNREWKGDRLAVTSHYTM